MLLSNFGRIGFDPFLEMRRMQQEMNQRLAGLIPTAAVFDSCGIPNIRIM